MAGGAVPLPIWAPRPGSARLLGLSPKSASLRKTVSAKVDTGMTPYYASQLRLTAPVALPRHRQYM